MCWIEWIGPKRIGRNRDCLESRWEEEGMIGEREKEGDGR